MRSHAIRAAILVVVLVCVVAPVAELFDVWDNTLQTGNDVESSLAVIAACLGMALVLTGSLFKLLRNPAPIESIRVLQECHSPVVAPSLRWDSHSPPTLRI